MMNQQSSIFTSARRRAFTLVEMMVAVSILVIIILSVGLVFRGAGQSVGISQASLEMLSNVRGVQQQIESDVAGMNKDAFLVIRCGTYTYTDPQTGVQSLKRCDQISFIANGSFRHRTGTTQTNPFTDSTVSPAALIWWGQLALAKQNSGWTAADSRKSDVFVSADESQRLPLDQVPTGKNESDYTLGRSAMLLVPQYSSSSALPSNNGTFTTASPDADTFAAFLGNPTGGGAYPLSSIDYYYAYGVSGHAVSPPSSEIADITQSRYDAAATSIDEIMGCIRQAVAPAGPNSRNNPYGVFGGLNNSYNRFEADHFCYRRAALRSPYEGTAYGTTSALVNGYFRMHPIALQGVSSFAIDWTDGSVFTDKDANMNGGTYTPGASNTAAPDLTTGKLIGKPTASNPVSEPFTGTTRWYGMCDPDASKSTSWPANGDVVAYARGAIATPQNAVLVVHNTTTPTDPDFKAWTTARQDNFVDNGNNSNSNAAGGPISSYGDSYTAIFSYDIGRAHWPVALRFRYHIVDPTGRLAAGRDFVQVVKLPN